MLYNCSNGKTLSLTTELYFSLLDLELDELCNCDAAQEINDPFYDSVISSGESRENTVNDDYEFLELDE